MYCILHITDLHRAKRDPISNAELISALMTDWRRYSSEHPPISKPEAIVVSGDIIQGVGLGAADFESEISAQYDVAYEFLVDLTNRLLGGDRAKVVIVPGNHDVDWNTARAAMRRVDAKDIPKGLPGLLSESESPYRWDWSSRELFVIDDKSKYQLRFAAFWRFFERFYNGVEGLLRVESWSDANLFSLDEGRIGLAAFNSCAVNDCFTFRGEISKEVVAQSHLDLEELGNWRLKVAVWHHDIEGPPDRSDYMDTEIVRGMIGRGYRLGLYGHQHRPQVTPSHVYLPERETMAVVSAGSLCAGAMELPTGARRGYSIIEIADDYRRARVHVREMAVANLFSRANLPIFGGRSYVDLEWTIPVDAAGRAEDTARANRSDVMLRAEQELKAKMNPRKAVELLNSIDAVSDLLGRRLLLEAAIEAGDADTLSAIFRQPVSISEMVAGVDYFVSRKELQKADQLVDENYVLLSVPDALRRDLKAKIQLARRAGQ